MQQERFSFSEKSLRTHLKHRNLLSSAFLRNFQQDKSHVSSLQSCLSAKITPQNLNSECHGKYFDRNQCLLTKNFDLDRHSTIVMAHTLDVCRSSVPSLTEELPAGWRCRQSRKWGRPFYYHSASGCSQWHPPSTCYAQDLKRGSTLC